MSGEWKRASWVYSPITLGHTYQHILNAIDALLIATGWERASWSNGGAIGTDNYYIRPDRLRLDLTSPKYGPSGDAAIAVTGAAMTKQNLTGGAYDPQNSTRSAGWVQFSAQPADGDTVTITDGVLTKTFEFDSNAALVTPGNVFVAIGSSIENTIENLAAAVNQQGFNLICDPHWHWWYTGDNYYQHCGIRVWYNAVSDIRISTFIENVGKTGSQQTNAVYATIAYNTTKDNSFLFVAGEDGFYMEGGVDGANVGIACAMIFAYYPDETLGGTRGRERTWNAQGSVCEFRTGVPLYGSAYYFMETVGDKRVHYCGLLGTVARGSASVTTKNIANGRQIYYGNRDHLMTHPRYSNNSAAEAFFYSFPNTLGLVQSNFDDVYRVSMLYAMQGISEAHEFYYDVLKAISGGAVGLYKVYDTRNQVRTIPKFGCCSSYLLPWNNITDRRTGQIFRVARVFGNSNLCIVWPSDANVVTILATP